MPPSEASLLGKNLRGAQCWCAKWLFKGRTLQMLKNVGFKADKPNIYNVMKALICYVMSKIVFNLLFMHFLLQDENGSCIVTHALPHQHTLCRFGFLISLSGNQSRAMMWNCTDCMYTGISWRRSEVLRCKQRYKKVKKRKKGIFWNLKPWCNCKLDTLL